MLLIENKDEGGQDRFLTVTSHRTSPSLKVVRIFEPDHKSDYSGKLLASIVLNAEDAADLKKNL